MLGTGPASCLTPLTPFEDNANKLILQMRKLAFRGTEGPSHRHTDDEQGGASFHSFTPQNRTGNSTPSQQFQMKRATLYFI